MTVDHVSGGSAAARATRAERLPRAFDKLTVGESLRLRVLERLGARDYVVSFGGERHRVESAVALEVGADVRVGVVAVGERLVLRHLDAKADEEGDLLAQLARSYGVALAAVDREPLLAAAAGAADPTRMLMSGLYLAKLGVAPDNKAVAAVYHAQRHGVASAAADAPDRKAPTADEPTLNAAAALVERFDDAFAAGGAHSDGGGAQSDTGEHGSSELARRALNLQDDGSVLYRYATLPLVIGGELRELQVALFTPREPIERGSDVRRLVMTLETPQLRQVRIETKSVGDRLAVAIDVAAPDGMEALAARDGEVRELLARLGWSVEAVSYGINVPAERAARRIVDHVLTSGTVDAVF